MMFCSPCCKKKGDNEKHHHDSKFLDCNLIDDDWADEFVWYDALETHSGYEVLAEGVTVDDIRAAESHDKTEQTFTVSDDELSTIKDVIATEFPQDSDYMSDAYLRSVASKPYSKDMPIRRPLEYTIEKLTHVMEWRKEMTAAELPDLVALCNKSPEQQKNVPKETLEKANAMVESLNTGSMYWHGLTKEGRPILWIRTNRKFWYPNIEAELNALIALADVGITCMPEGVTDFVCISHSYKPAPPNPGNVRPDTDDAEGF